MDRKIETITRTVTISDLTPEEMASIFSGWSDDQQAAFFHALHVEAASWPNGGGWWLQMANAVAKMSCEACDTLREFADALGDR